jgi:hypothetical protein
MSSTFCMHGPVEKKQRMKLIMKEREIEKGNVYIWKVLARWSSWSENQNTLKEMAGSLFSLQIIVSLLFIFLFLLEAVHGTKKVGFHAIYFNYLMFLVSNNMINYVLLIKFPSFNLWHFTNRWSCFTVLHCILGSTFSWSSPYISWTWNCYQFSLWFTKLNLGKVYNASYDYNLVLRLIFLSVNYMIIIFWN